MFEKKRMKSYEEATSIRERWNKIGSLALIVTVALFAVAIIIPSLAGFCMILFLTGALWIFAARNAAHAKTCADKLEKLACTHCGKHLSLDDVQSFSSGAEKYSEKTSEEYGIKSKYKNETPERLAARQYIGEEIYGTNKTTSRSSDLPVFATFVCPECGVKHVEKAIISAHEHQVPTKMAAEEYFMNHYFQEYTF